jgi:hypothetical protein
MECSEKAAQRENRPGFICDTSSAAERLPGTKGYGGR